MAFDDQINQWISNASSNYGVSSSWLTTTLSIENQQGNTSAVSPTGATGLFQFTGSTWNQYGMGGSITNGQDSANAAANYASSLNSYLSGAVSSLGGTVQDWQTYLAYQQGPGAAANALNGDPNAPISQYISANNLSVNGWDPNQSTGSFLQGFQNMWNSKAGASAGGSSGSGTPQAAVSSGGSSASSGNIWDTIGQYFTRAALVLLGIIFVYAGLRMFGVRSGAIAAVEPRQLPTILPRNKVPPTAIRIVDDQRKAVAKAAPKKTPPKDLLSLSDRQEASAKRNRAKHNRQVAEATAAPQGAVKPPRKKRS